MKSQQLCVMGLVALLAMSAQAVVPDPLPDITIQVSPEDPGPSDALSLTLAGTWPDSCVPQGLDISVIEGDSIWISLLLPGWDTKGECKAQVCLEVLTEWEQTSVLQALPTGDYDVFVRGVACQEYGTYELLTVLSIGTGQGHLVANLFKPGERVVLLQDDPPGGLGLKTGHGGTVICCDAPDCLGNILVSWDLWTQGKADPSLCINDVTTYYPPNSVIWVDPTEVLVGSVFDQCGTIRRGLEGCVHFEADDGKTYNLVATGDLSVALGTDDEAGFDDRVRVQGVLNTTVPAPDVIRICPQWDGDIYHPIVSSCPVVELYCCDEEYQPGDRVVLLVDNPTGPDGRAAANLYAEMEGTVICCNAEDPQFPIYVSWDNWTYGSDQDAPCPNPIMNHPEGSGRSMACVQIAPARTEPPIDPPDDITIGLGTNALGLVLVGPSTGGGYTYSGCVDLLIELNFRALITVEVTPAPGIGGNWSGTLDPNIIGPGEEEVELCVEVQNLDISNLPAGQNIQVATVTLYAQPAP